MVNNMTISDPLEKTEALREEILNRYTAEDDLRHYPDQEAAVALPWSTYISLEETERNTIGVSSTSPGTDRSTVRPLRACWAQVGELVRRIFQRCLELNYFPAQWKLAEVAMIPKTGKTDRTSPRSWRLLRRRPPLKMMETALSCYLAKRRQYIDALRRASLQ
jgi:hypothetical protein